MPEITPKQPGKLNDLHQVVGVQQAQAGIVEISPEERSTRAALLGRHKDR
jgi:hypothetical protein